MKHPKHLSTCVYCAHAGPCSRQTPHSKGLSRSELRPMTSVHRVAGVLESARNGDTKRRVSGLYGMQMEQLISRKENPVGHVLPKPRPVLLGAACMRVAKFKNNVTTQRRCSQSLSATAATAAPQARRIRQFRQGGHKVYRERGNRDRRLVTPRHAHHRFFDGGGQSGQTCRTRVGSSSMSSSGSQTAGESGP